MSCEQHMHAVALQHNLNQSCLRWHNQQVCAIDLTLIGKQTVTYRLDVCQQDLKLRM